MLYGACKKESLSGHVDLTSDTSGFVCVWGCGQVAWEEIRLSGLADLPMQRLPYATWEPFILVHRLIIYCIRFIRILIRFQYVTLLVTNTNIIIGGNNIKV